VQGLPKGQKTDAIIRQACEAGAASLQFVETQHCVPDLHEKADRKLQRWERIAREAFQQSGNHSRCQIYPFVSLSAWLNQTFIPSQQANPEQLGLFCHQTHLEQGSLHQYCNSRPKDIFIVIGPEGGFSSKETDILTEHGLRPVLLGPWVLRTETAALFAMASVQMILLEADSWALKPPSYATKNENLQTGSGS
jgi:16S rRNA (uracil1498-N3)-methyltransferase